MCVFCLDISISDALFNGVDSYMTFLPVYIKRETHIITQIKPGTSSGLIFYASQHYHTIAGDFLALVLEEGYPELRFNLGSGLINVRSDLKLEIGNTRFLVTGVDGFVLFIFDYSVCWSSIQMEPIHVMIHPFLKPTSAKQFIVYCC